MGSYSASRILLILLVLRGSVAHVQLTFPPGSSPNDYLDNLHTVGLCGNQRSSRKDAPYWFNFPALNAPETVLTAGANVNVSWNSHAPHQGGFTLSLYQDPTVDGAQPLYSWNSSSHLGCTADGTQVWVLITLPTEPCANCTLRLFRQYIENGFDNKTTGFLMGYQSCAPVTIAASAPQSGCWGCSGHGTCQAGKCVCDSSPETGYWEGTYCERENECDSDNDCGQWGVCVDTHSRSPPRKQCFCQEGYFGPERVTKGGWASRTCDRESKLQMEDDDSDWVNQYDNNMTSINGTYRIYWKIIPDQQQIEFAIAAQTRNWVGMGFRPQYNNTVGFTSEFTMNPLPKPTSLGECPSLQPGEAVLELADTGVGAAASAPTPSTGRRLTQAANEGEQATAGNVSALTINNGYLTTQSQLNETFGQGTCKSVFTNVNDVPSMTNSDIVVTMAIPNAQSSRGVVPVFRIQDSFTPNRGRPQPDRVYGGVDDIADAVARESEDGWTYIKFRRNLTTSDSVTDYCLLQDITYSLIYAYGQNPTASFSNPKSALQIGAAVQDPNFYKLDVLQYHGGGNYITDRYYNNRANLGAFNFWDKRKASAGAGNNNSCEKSTLGSLGYDCMYEAIPGAYWLHWNVSDPTLLKLAGEAQNDGWVGIGFPNQIPAQMIGSHAVIGWIDTVKGNSINIYNLVNRDVTSNIVPDNSAFNITDASITKNAGRTVMSFTRPLTANEPPTLFLPDGSLNLIVAYHADAKVIVHHTGRQVVAVNLQSGRGVSNANSSLNNKYGVAHGVLNSLAYAFFLPLGVIVARYFKADLRRKWFPIHIGVQLTGLFMTLAAIIIAGTQLSPIPNNKHKTLGFIVFGLAWLQPFTSLPVVGMHHGYTLRNVAWEYVHWTVGRAAIILGIANIFFGLARFRELWPSDYDDYSGEMAVAIYVAIMLLVLWLLEGRALAKRAAAQKSRDEGLARRLGEMEAMMGRNTSKNPGSDDDFSDDDDDLDGFNGPPLPRVRPNGRGVGGQPTSVEMARHGHGSTANPAYAVGGATPPV